jgi:hypothetical protein
MTGVRLSYAGKALGRQTIWLFGLSVVVAGLVIFGFGWNARDVAVGTAIGIPLWGSVKFFTDVVHSVPRGTLPEPPVGTQVGGGSRGPVAVLGVTVFALVACAGLAWLADALTVGAVFAPGQFAGYTCACGVGALLIARWERVVGRRVLIDESDDAADDPRLYASSAAAGPG